MDEACYFVGDGFLCPSRRGLLGLLAQTSKSRPAPCLYRYTRRDLSSFSLPPRGRGTATRWKEFYATLSFRHFLAKMPPPSMREANKLSSRRRLQGCFARLQIPPVSATPANAYAFANPTRLGDACKVLRTLANPSRSPKKSARKGGFLII